MRPSYRKASEQVLALEALEFTDFDASLTCIRRKFIVSVGVGNLCGPMSFRCPRARVLPRVHSHPAPYAQRHDPFACQLPTKLMTARILLLSSF